MAYPELFGDPTSSGMTTTNDGAAIAWQSFGKPRKDWPTVVCCNGVGCSTFFWHYLARYFRERGQVLIWDYRGHGDSSFPKDIRSEMTIPRMAEDLEAVLVDAKVERGVAIGHSMGAQVILEHLRNHPGRIRGLVPLLGTYGHPLKTFFDTALVATLFPIAYHFVRNLPYPVQAVTKFLSGSRITLPAAAITRMVNGTTIKASDLKAYMENLASLDMRVFIEMANDMGKHTAEDILGAIKIPVLVMGGERDIYTPIHRSHRLHALVPGSELLIIPGGSHAGLVEQPELINLRLEKFIKERVIAHPTYESATARVLDMWSENRVAAGKP